MFLFCLVFAMFCARLFICAFWSPAGKGLTSWLSFVVSSVSLSLSHWYPGSGVVLIVSIHDLCNLITLPFLKYSKPFAKIRDDAFTFVSLRTKSYLIDPFR